MEEFIDNLYVGTNTWRALVHEEIKNMCINRRAIGNGKKHIWKTPFAKLETAAPLNNDKAVNFLKFINESH